MAAGLGFKDFVTGEVLTAADVDGYLMQGIWVFDDATARDAAVTSPQEGNFAFLKDTNVTTFYDGAAWVNVDTTGMTNPMTTTADIIYSSSGSTPARLGIGTVGQVLQVNSGATAPEWATPASGSSGPAFRAFRQTTSQSILAATWTKAQLQGETYDTDNCWDSTTNYRFTPNKAGYYQLNSTLIHVGGQVMNIAIYKNGAQASAGTSMDTSAGGNGSTVVSDIIYLNGSSDYVEIYIWNNLATAIFNSSVEAFFSGIWIRS